jgi:hypothetical protein
MKNISHFRVFLALLSFVLVFSGLRGQGFFDFPPASPFNKRAVTAPDSGWSYTFLAGGHLYGAHENERSVFPAASLMGNLNRLNANPTMFFVATGDILRSSKDPAIIDAAQTAFSGFTTPLFNAPGNHDLDDRAAYEKVFGIVGANTFFRLPGSANQFGFFVRDDFYLIMDSEYLLEGQTSQIMSFLDRELKRLKERPQTVRHVFVFSHRLLWALCIDDFAAADDLANEPLKGKVDADSACLVVDRVLGLPHTGETYWIAGDVGTHWSVPLLYGRDKSKKLTAIASGIGDTPEDALLKVTVSPEGKVTLGTLPLTNANWNPVESYTLPYWDKNQKSIGNSESGSGFFDKIKAAMGGEVFWGALGIGLVLGLVVARIWRRKRNAT